MRRIASLLMPLALSASALHGQDISSRLDSVMKVAEAKGFSGVVRISKHGEIVFEEGYGLANRAEKIPFTPATVVQIGSNTKDFTAVAILQLQQRGLLNVQDKLIRFFPNAPADKKDITIWQLMKHEAGYPLGLGGDFDKMSRQALIDSAMAFKLLFKPGSRQSYSNTGYSILAAIIELVSKKSYDEYVRDNILAPLKLTHTGFLLPGFSSRDLARGYRANGEDAGTMLEKPHASDGPYWNLRGNGGMLSTLGDMSAFYTALFETEKLLPLNARNGMFDPKQPIGLAGSDGINFFLYERMPMMGIESMIASTNAAVKASAIRRELGPVLGLPSMDGARSESGDAPLARAGGKPVTGPASKLIDDFVATFNKGDKAALAKFIGDNYVLAAGDPSADQRAERLIGIYSDLGALTVLRKTAIENGPIQVLVKTEHEGEALLIFDISPSEPYKVRRFGIQVGG